MISRKNSCDECNTKAKYESVKYIFTEMRDENGREICYRAFGTTYIKT